MAATTEIIASRNPSRLQVKSGDAAIAAPIANGVMP